MTLQECYTAIGGDYDDVLGRLRSEKMIEKFVFKFLDDLSYELLCSSMREQNREEAFRAAHTIKGICQNLSFTRLYNSSSKLCEALRNSWEPEAPELKLLVDEDYKLTADAIRTLQKETL